MPHTQAQIEEALAAGRLEVYITGGRWWRARRNGATKTWVTRPGEFRVPIKAGFKLCGCIQHNTPLDVFRIVER